jgi:hypothetical protein
MLAQAQVGSILQRVQTGLAIAMAVAEPAPRLPAQAEPTRVPPPTVELPDLRTKPIVLALQLDAALNAGDVEAGLALFDPEAQVKVPPDVYRGTSQIRGWLSYLAANHFAAEPGLRRVAGETATWPAEARSDQLARLGLDSVAGTATVVVGGDKITAYTFVLDRESASRLRAAQLAASDVLQDPLVVGVDSANVYGPADVFRTPDGQLVSYREVVGAEPGSGPFFDLGGQPITIRTGL